MTDFALGFLCAVAVCCFAFLMLKSSGHKEEAQVPKPLLFSKADKPDNTLGRIHMSPQNRHEKMQEIEKRRKKDTLRVKP